MWESFPTLDGRDSQVALERWSDKTFRCLHRSLSSPTNPQHIVSASSDVRLIDHTSIHTGRTMVDYRPISAPNNLISDDRDTFLSMVGHRTIFKRCVKDGCSVGMTTPKLLKTHRQYIVYLIGERYDFWISQNRWVDNGEIN